MPPPDPTAAELAYYAQWAPVIQMRTLSVLKKWLDLHPEDIRDSAGAQLAIHQLLHRPPYVNLKGGGRVGKEWAKGTDKALRHGLIL